MRKSGSISTILAMADNTPTGKRSMPLNLSLSTVSGQQQEYLRFHVERCNAGAGQKAFGSNDVRTGFMTGLRGVERERSFGQDEATVKQ